MEGGIGRDIHVAMVGFFRPLMHKFKARGAIVEVLGRLNSGAKAIMLGPSTPMVPRAFAHLPLCLLAGTVPLDQKGVLKEVRQFIGLYMKLF
jgi:uncharacterized protein